MISLMYFAVDHTYDPIKRWILTCFGCYREPQEDFQAV